MGCDCMEPVLPLHEHRVTLGLGGQWFLGDRRLHEQETWILPRFVCVLVCVLALFCFSVFVCIHSASSLLTYQTQRMAAADGGKVVAERG